MTYTTLPAPIAVGQKIGSPFYNTVLAAVGELQTATVNQPAMELPSAGMTNISATAWVVVNTFGAATSTLGTGLTATASGVVVAQTGRYQCSAAVQWGAGVAGTIRYVTIGTNLTWTNTVRQMSLMPTNSFMVALEISANAGDTIGIWLRQTDTLANGVITSARLAVRRLTS